MKYSKHIGIASAVALIITCFLPWVVVPGLDITLSGVHGKVSEQANFGLQIIPHSFFCILMVICFLLPSVGAKRANLVLGAMHFAWALKNYYVFTTCRAGDCPEKQFGIYAVIILAFIMMIMSFLPEVQLRDNDSRIQ